MTFRYTDPTEFDENELNQIANGICPKCGSELSPCENYCHWTCFSKQCVPEGSHARIYELRDMAFAYVMIQMLKKQLNEAMVKDARALVQRLLDAEAIGHDQAGHVYDTIITYYKL